MVNQFLPEGNMWTAFTRSPYVISTYLQDKLEFQGFISTLGLIAEYSDTNGNWYDVDVYNRAEGAGLAYVFDILFNITIFNV